MTIDPKTLPDGTAFQQTEDTRVMFTSHGGERYALGPANVGFEALTFELPSIVKVRRVYVPVPDGLSVEDAEKALTDARPWVPIPGGPTKAHLGKRVRLISALVNDCEITDRITGVDADGEIRLVACGENWYGDSGDWFVHPDDVPTDPDADLIERITRAIDGYRGVGDEGRIARAVLAVVRASEATR